jgi:hypothetical protein
VVITPPSLSHAFHALIELIRPCFLDLQLMRLALAKSDWVVGKGRARDGILTG